VPNQGFVGHFPDAHQLLEWFVANRPDLSSVIRIIPVHAPSCRIGLVTGKPENRLSGSSKFKKQNSREAQKTKFKVSSEPAF
jgi:hypothetical protein